MALLGWNDSRQIDDEAPERRWKRRFFMMGTFFPKFFVLNLILLVASAGVVTLPAALAGVNRVCFQIIQKKRFSIWYDFWSEFRESFRRVSLPGLFLLFLLFFAGFAARLAGRRFEGTVRYVSVGFSGFVMLLAFLILCYMLAMAAITDLSAAAIVKNAVLLIFFARRETFLLICLGAVLILFVGFFPFSLIAVFFGTPAFLAYAGCSATFRAMSRYVLEDDGTQNESPRDDGRPDGGREA